MQRRIRDAVKKKKITKRARGHGRRRPAPRSHHRLGAGAIDRAGEARAAVVEVDSFSLEAYAERAWTDGPHGPGDEWTTLEACARNLPQREALQATRPAPPEGVVFRGTRCTRPGPRPGREFCTMWAAPPPAATASSIPIRIWPAPGSPPMTKLRVVALAGLPAPGLVSCS